MHTLRTRSRKTPPQSQRTKAQLAGTIGVISAVGAADLRGAGAAIHKVSILYGKGWNDCGHGGASLECTSKGYSQPFKRNRVNANDIAEDVYNAISAGQKTEDAVGFVGQAVKLAKGGFAETGQALDVMTTILNAYGKESSEAGAVADMLIQTAE